MLKKIFKNSHGTSYMYLAICSIFVLGYLAGALFGVPYSLFDDYNDCVLKELYTNDANREIGSMKEYSLQEILGLTRKEKDRIIRRLEIAGDVFSIQDFSADSQKIYIDVQTALAVCK